MLLYIYMCLYAYTVVPRLGVLSCTCIIILLCYVGSESSLNKRAHEEKGLPVISSFSIHNLKYYNNRAEHDLNNAKEQLEEYKKDVDRFVAENERER